MQQHRQRRQAAVHRHLWGPQSLRWRPLQPAQTVTRTRRSGKLLIIFMMLFDSPGVTLVELQSLYQPNQT